MGRVRGSGASIGSITTATAKGRTCGSSTEKRTDICTVGTVQQDRSPHELSERITGSLLCRLQQLWAFALRRQHSMPFKLGPDHNAAKGMACKSRNSTKTTLPQQRRPIELKTEPIHIDSRVS